MFLKDWGECFEREENREKTQELPDGLEDESGRYTTLPIATTTT